MGRATRPQGTPRVEFTIGVRQPPAGAGRESEVDALLPAVTNRRLVRALCDVSTRADFHEVESKVPLLSRPLSEKELA